MSTVLTQETITYTDPDGFDSTQTLWFGTAGTHIFTYDHGYRELWDELTNQNDPPVTFPETLEQARSIIESKGYTIA